MVRKTEPNWRDWSGTPEKISQKIKKDTEDPKMSGNYFEIFHGVNLVKEYNEDSSV